VGLLIRTGRRDQWRGMSDQTKTIFRKEEDRRSTLPVAFYSSKSTAHNQRLSKVKGRTTLGKVVLDLLEYQVQGKRGSLKALFHNNNNNQHFVAGTPHFDVDSN
jgi:hypothetical protein